MVRLFLTRLVIPPIADLLVESDQWIPGPFREVEGVGEVWINRGHVGEFTDLGGLGLRGDRLSRENPGTVFRAWSPRLFYICICILCIFRFEVLSSFSVLYAA